MRRLGPPYNPPPIQSSGCDLRRYVEEAYRSTRSFSDGDPGDAQERTPEEKVETLALLYGKYAFPSIRMTPREGRGWWDYSWDLVWKDVRTLGYTDHDSGDEAS